MFTGTSFAQLRDGPSGFGRFLGGLARAGPRVLGGCPYLEVVLLAAFSGQPIGKWHYSEP